jgi:transposase
MISVEVIQRIQALTFEQGKTYKEISEELEVSSKTIAKALLRPEEILDGYQRAVPVTRPIVGPVEGRIEELLKGKDWSREKGRKVRRTARWVWRQLKKEGFEGAESTVRTYVREKLKQPRPACPIEHPPAVEAQFDFGQRVVKVDGRPTVVHFVGAIFPFSTRRFLFPYPAERQECLFDAMEKTYQAAGGLTELATLDNTALAVKKVLEGRRREETEAYERFRTALGVAPRYTNRAAGWEKGHAEGTVGWAKRQLLTDLEVKDWDELRKILRDECDLDARTRRYGEQGKLVAELFADECQLLRPLRYEGRRSYRVVRPRVTPGGMVYVDGSRYSVPIQLRGRDVRVHLLSDELVVICGGEIVARYDRDWTGRGEHYCVEHYLALLERAPALLDHGKPFVRMPSWLHQVREALDDDRGLISLLLSIEKGKYTFEELNVACCTAMAQGAVTAAVIEQKTILARSAGDRDIQELEAKDCAGLAKHRFEIESPAIYDELLQGVGVA